MIRSFLLGMLAFVAIGLSPASAQTTPAANRAPNDLQRMSTSFEALARQVQPAVVQVQAQRYSGINRSGGGRTRLSEERSTGSGFFVDSSGVIVTNAHVVAGAHRVQVQLASSPPPPPGEASILRERGALREATVVGLDTETDVAVLRVQGSGYPTLDFGNSDRLRAGQLVFAFGSPMGLENSVSMGVVSATARQLEPGDPMIYVQTDAPINPGSSGGPLVNGAGEVVGLNTFIVSPSGGSDGLGFAGPSNIVRDVSRQIREHGRVRRGVIGVNAQTVTPELAQAMNLDGSARVVLADVYPGSPAERAGLRAGDVVTRLNGEPMHNGRELDVNLYGDLGSLATLTVLRGDSTFQASVRVVERRDDRARFAELASPDTHLVERLGILALPLTDEVSALVSNLRLPSGALVAASNAPPTPWGDRLQPGDVIYRVEGTRIGGPQRLRQLLDAHSSDDRLLLHVLREGNMQYLVLQVE